jgi:hypothetical protein
MKTIEQQIGDLEVKIERVKNRVVREHPYCFGTASGIKGETVVKAIVYLKNSKENLSYARNRMEERSKMGLTQWDK